MEFSFEFLICDLGIIRAFYGVHPSDNLLYLKYGFQFPIIDNGVGQVLAESERGE
jgi:hypothetical protein